MSVLLINASPRGNASNSAFFLKQMRCLLPEEDVDQTDLRGTSALGNAEQKMAAADHLVFFAPLYVDGLPSHLLACLLELFDRGVNLRPATVYGVINCGFYEGDQARIALQILGNWACAMGLQDGGGIGIGGGEAAQAVPSAQKGPLGPVLAELRLLAERINEPCTEPVAAFPSVAITRFLYKLAADSGWRRQVRRNGGRPRDLGMRRVPPAGR